MRVHLVLGNQLFAPELLTARGIGPKTHIIFLREDAELCTYYRFHCHKIIFFLAAMRTYAAELEAAGYRVHYEKLDNSAPKYEERLLQFIAREKLESVEVFEIEDKFFETRIRKVLSGKKIELRIHESPMFLTSREDFSRYLKSSKKPFMKTFYELQRRRLNLLVDAEKNPVGGKWSFDDENRFPLPKGVEPPLLGSAPTTPEIEAVKEICRSRFSNHPGVIDQFWLPVDRDGARKWFRKFLSERLEFFGTYEDALAPDSEFVFHSVLTPFLNTGLLTPNEIIHETLRHAKTKKTPLNSVEGFIRQIIGWREFVRGIYQNFSEKQDSENFWKHERELSEHWYRGETGIPPLDLCLKKVLRYGYAHHIERLMVVGSLMLLLEVNPKSAHRWFMEMFIDSSDWVMGPNVYGMALFSDGGIFATKPYICGSNYYRKMGGFKPGPWCDAVDGLYWQFIDKHRDFFLRNPRLSMIARSVEKMDPARKKKIYSAANALREKLTSPSS